MKKLVSILALSSLTLAAPANAFDVDAIQIVDAVSGLARCNDSSSTYSYCRTESYGQTTTTWNVASVVDRRSGMTMKCQNLQ